MRFFGGAWSWFWVLRWRWKASIVVVAALVVIGAIVPAGTDDGSRDVTDSAPGVVATTTSPTAGVTATATPTPTPTLTPAATPEPLGACEQAFSDAASISSLEDTVEDLNPAVRACGTLDEWSAAALKYPAALDGADSTTFLQNRCLDAKLSGAPLCRETTGDFSQSDARDRVIECLEAVGLSDTVAEEIAALRRGVAGLQVNGGWFIERDDPAKFDLPGFPSWSVDPGGRVTAITDEAAALIPGGSDVLCES